MKVKVQSQNASPSKLFISESSKQFAFMFISALGSPPDPDDVSFVGRPWSFSMSHLAIINAVVVAAAVEVFVVSNYAIIFCCPQRKSLNRSTLSTIGF